MHSPALKGYFLQHTTVHEFVKSQLLHLRCVDAYICCDAYSCCAVTHAEMHNQLFQCSQRFPTTGWHKRCLHVCSDKHSVTFLTYVQSVPGPGQYNVPSMLQTGPTFTMAQRTPRKESKKDVPGVGTYDSAPSDQRSGPAFTAAARPAAFTAPDDMPGPGAYFDPERDRHASLTPSCIASHKNRMPGSLLPPLASSGLHWALSPCTVSRTPYRSSTKFWAA